MCMVSVVCECAKKVKKEGFLVPEATYHCLCAIEGRNIDNDDGTANHQVKTSRGEYWSSGKILQFLGSSENLALFYKQNVTLVELLFLKILGLALNSLCILNV